MPTVQIEKCSRNAKVTMKSVANVVGCEKGQASGIIAIYLIIALTVADEQQDKSFILYQVENRLFVGVIFQWCAW